MQLARVLIEVVGGSLAVGAVLTTGVRRLFRGRTHLLTNEGGSPALRAITATYALLLAFVLATSLQSFQSARSQVVSEADTVVSLGNLAHLLPAPADQRVQRALACYADTVVTSEFPAMRAGTLLPDDDKALQQLYRALPEPGQASTVGTGVAGAVLQ